MMDTIRIGIVGLGFGQHHVHTIANMGEARVAAVADLRTDFPGGLETYAGRYGARAYQDALEMIDKEDLDAISICTSPRYREPIITAAAQKGLPMFVEKPWATDLTHAKHLAAICKQYNAQVMVGFSFRFHPVVARLRQLMDGELGPGWMLNGQYVFSWLPPAAHWLWDPQNGNGFFNENSCHLFDVVCSLMGEPTTLSAEGINPLGSPSESGAAIVMRFAQEGIASLMIGGLGSQGVNGYPGLNIITKNGQARLGGREHYWEDLTWTVRGQNECFNFNKPPESLQNMRYTHAFQHFFDCVRSGRQPNATIEDGIRSVAIAEAVYESLRSGSKVFIKM